MKFAFILLLVGSNYSFAQDKSNLENRVTALEKKMSGPIVLSECYKVPTTVKASWVSQAETNDRDGSGLRYSKILSIPFQKVQTILVDSKIYNRVLNRQFPLVIYFSDEDNETSKLLKLANSELKDEVESYVLCNKN